MSERTGHHLTTRSSLRDVLSHPAFRGFGDQVLPWEDRAYDEHMPLSRIGSLLPYHSHVDPQTVTSALNRMIDDVSGGKTVFYRFYTEAQVREQPSRALTGLFLFRGRPGAPFAVICPGGGFAYVGSVHEGFPYAAAISDRGYNAFVLRYRAQRGGEVATQDLAAAISFIFSHAKALEVGTDAYSLWGSSAGARMAAAPVRAGVTAEPKGEPGDPVLIRGDLLDAGDPVAANLVFPLAKGLGTAANGSSSKIVATHVSLAIRGLA